MRVKPGEFQNQVKRALSDKRGLPMELEARLFAQAEDLLAAKRERLVSRETDSRRVAQKKAHFYSWCLDLIAIRPDIPAVATALAVLVFAFLALHSSHDRRMSFTFADLPDFPENNDASDRYDAQRVAEQNAYESEVEDAHEKTSGGI